MPLVSLLAFPRLAELAMGRVSGGHGAFQLSVLLTPSVFPDFGRTKMSYLYTCAPSLDHEICRGYASTKINILAQKVRLRHKCGVRSSALGSANLPNPHWFGTERGDHEISVPGRNMEYGFEIQFCSKSE